MQKYTRKNTIKIFYKRMYMNIGWAMNKNETIRCSKSASECVFNSGTKYYIITQ